MSAPQDSATDRPVDDSTRAADAVSAHAAPAPSTAAVPGGALHDPSAIGLSRLTLSRIDLPRLDRARVAPLPPFGRTIDHDAAPAAGSGAAGPPVEPPVSQADAASDDESAPPSLVRRSLLAASVALAAVVGIGAGAAATGYFLRADTSPAAVTAAVDETRALRETVVRLSTDLATLQSKLDTSSRSTNAHFAKLADRLERAEKANSEPNAKLAKIADGLDRLEKKAATTTAAAAAPEVTGSVTPIPKSVARPTELDGWRLRDFNGGRALVENRAGDLYEVGPGSSIPGIGRVESIRREDGKIVVLTPKGQISGPVAMRRPAPPPQRYMQYRY